MGGSLVGLGVLKVDSLDVPGRNPLLRKANTVCLASEWLLRGDDWKMNDYCLNSPVAGLVVTFPILVLGSTA